MSVLLCSLIEGCSALVTGRWEVSRHVPAVKFDDNLHSFWIRVAGGRSSGVGHDDIIPTFFPLLHWPETDFVFTPP